MSTRSGKRIHKSFSENILNETTDVILKSDRKTRSRRLKENCETLNISLPKAKKQKNYVRYPTDDEAAADADSVVGQPVLRSLRKTTLREINNDVITASNAAENTKGDDKEKKPVRLTRKSRKAAGNSEENDELCQLENENTLVDNEGKKSKKNKRKKPLSDSDEKTTEYEQEDVLGKKSRKKKRNGKIPNSTKVEETAPKATHNARKSLNMTNTSLESFHSAAGSPLARKSRTPRKDTKLNGTLDNLTEIEINEDFLPNADTTLTLEYAVPLSNVLNNTSGNALRKTSDVPPGDITFDLKEAKEPDETLTNLNTTFDKGDEPRTAPQKTLNDNDTAATCHQNDENLQSRDKVNSTPTPAKSAGASTAKALDTTFDKLSDFSINNSDTKKLNSTYDKLVNGDSSPAKSKSSLISSDNSGSTNNLTFDKSDEYISRVSLTSDDSKSSTENILDTTPVLIESSMETSGISEASPNPPTPKAEPESTEQSPKPPSTPLKREGTFTKDGPDVIFVTSPKPKQSIDDTTVLKTPVKVNKLPTSPGRTPFHSKEKAATREKSILNRTHSVEKPTRQSVVAVPTKITRVTFCSPVDCSVLNTQRKSKMIKSSLKSSNKSFAFEEKGTPESPLRPASRKRSLTQPDAEQATAKRKRLADDLQTSVDRLSRPRTLSANAKPSDPGTPSKSPGTPAVKSEVKATRSRLPDFAALHQRRFQKMESLDECQERKAKRAKQLLVPTGSLAVLERSSPKASEAPASTKKDQETKKLQPLHTKTDPPKSQPPPTRAEPVKSLVPTKTEAPKLPTKTEPKPTYTRFGYKLNLDVNPFSIPSQNPEPKPVSKPQLTRQPTLPFLAGSQLTRQPTLPFLAGSQLTRQPTLPSLAGSTARKELAKQVIMREKSATTLREKRGVDRKESRTIIKGVRTNRRFELQMRSRNING